MKVYKEITLRDFDAWSGAVNTLETLERLENISGYENAIDIVESCICDCEEYIDETIINDILWFEDDTIAEWLDFPDWEALETFVNENV